MIVLVFLIVYYIAKGISLFPRFFAWLHPYIHIEWFLHLFHIFFMARI